jgi:uncharacterized RDD family membrane protein YckC
MGVDPQGCSLSLRTMNWYYENGGQQAGPVDDASLNALVLSGTLQGSTLVWREGMNGWQPLSLAVPQLVPTTTAAAPTIGGVAVAAEHKDLYVQQLREGVETQVVGGTVYGGFWWRFLAYVIDSFALGAVGAVVQIGFALAMGSGFSTNYTKPEGIDGMAIVLMIAMMVVLMALNFGYFAVFTKLYQATPGKMAVGLVVTDSELRPLTWGRSWLRALGVVLVSPLAAGVTIVLVLGILAGFGFLLSGGMDAFSSKEPPVFFMAAIGLGLLLFPLAYWPYYMAGRDPEKRALHDRICGTRVLKKS